MYATEQDVLERWDGVPVDAGDPAFTRALDDASALIDTYLSRRWEVPLEVPPRLLVTVCVDIASYLLCRTDNALSEDIRQRYDDALALLKSVARGELDLPGLESTPSGDGASGPGAVVLSGPERLFGRGKGW